MAKNFGDQIIDAIQSAVTSQDFSNLQKTVGDSLGQAADGIRRGLEEAQRSAREANERRQQEQLARQQELAWQNQQRMEMARIQERYLKVGGTKAAGYLMGIVGGVCTASFGAALASTVSLLSTHSIASGYIAGSVMALALFAGSVALLVGGVRKVGIAKRFEAYERIIGPRQSVSVAELAHRTGRTVAQVQKDLRQMIARGYFRQGHLDMSETLLLVSTEAYQRYLNDQRIMRERARQERAQKAIEEPKAQASSAQSGISPEAQAILDRGYAYIAQIRTSNKAIPGEEVTRKIDQMERVVDSIFEHAREHPEVIGDLERLMDYYLPVTVKLLDAYEDLDSQPVQSESIQASKREIEDTLDTLNIAFEKLLDSVFQEMTWDVSTDISVLHTVLAQEGLVNNPFEKKRDQ